MHYIFLICQSNAEHPQYYKLLQKHEQFTQFEIAFAYSTKCLCVFILPPGRHAMLLQCANMYARTDHSNTKYNTKSNFFGLGSLNDTVCRLAKVNHDLTIQLLIIITSFSGEAA